MNKLVNNDWKDNILIKNDSKGHHGKNPDERSIEELINFGVVVVDKASGPTSHQVSAYVKQILEVDKTGHSGTLDPKVTGVLPNATQNATRLNEYLLNMGKEYVALMHLHKPVSEDKIRDYLNNQVGTITQMPPVKSAVKRRKRKREIYYLDIIEIKGQDVLFRVGVEAGTYIRTLCHDCGKALSIGAHMKELRRTKVAHYTEDEAYSLIDLNDAYKIYKKKGIDKYIRKILKPAESIVKNLPKVWVKDSAVWYVSHGSPLAVPGVSKLHDFEQSAYVAIMTLKNELVAIGRASMNTKNILKERKGIAVTIDKVLMDEDYFPKMVKK